MWRQATSGVWLTESSGYQPADEQSHARGRQCDVALDRINWYKARTGEQGIYTGLTSQVLKSKATQQAALDQTRMNNPR